MSRTGWAVLLLFGGAAGFGLFFLTRPLPDHVVTAATATGEAVTAAGSTVDSLSKRLDELVKADAEWLGARPEVAEARKRLDAAKAQFAEVEQRYQSEVRKRLDANDYADAERLARAAQEVQGAAQGVTAAAATAVGAVEETLTFKRDHQALRQAATAAAEQARQVADDAAFRSGVELAATSYPEAKPVLDKSYADLRANAEQIGRTAAAMEPLAAANPPDYVAVGKMAKAITDSAQRLQAQKSELQSDLAELARSVDKILVDMKEEGGRYYHKYKMVENGQERETDWVEVTRAEFEKHEPNLGMSIYSKPEGVREEDAVTVASPPGYAYVGNPRYGQWQSDGHGGHFWSFFGTYLLMSHMLSGPGYYRPIGRADWNRYDNDRRAGRPYYGPNREHGSQGSQTRSRYASSRYVSQGGARASAPRSSPTTTRSTPRTTYRTSRYRGSPRFGGGRRR